MLVQHITYTHTGIHVCYTPLIPEVTYMYMWLYSSLSQRSHVYNYYTCSKTTALTKQHGLEEIGLLVQPLFTSYLLDSRSYLFPYKFR